ncbi:MAG: ketoacyl-ACP synthase III [Oligoflexales bacterium]
MDRSPQRPIITAMGHYHPENRIDNSFFDELEIGSDSEWIQDRTGIRSRRMVLNREQLRALKEKRLNLEELKVEGTIGIEAFAKKCWEHLSTRWNPANGHKKIDALICGTSVPDFDIPANACAVASALGLNCAAFDANSACSSFVVDLHVARALIQNGSFNRIAIVNPERYSLRMDYNDKSSCILFGDGCAASILQSGENEHGLEIVDTLVESDPAGYDLVRIKDSGNFWQNGKAVQKFAITKTVDATNKILERNNITARDISYFIGHQANLRMVSSAADRLGISEDKHLHNVAELGNQGAAGAPAVLSMNWNRFKPGDFIVVSVVGSGLTWASALLRYV